MAAAVSGLSPVTMHGANAQGVQTLEPLLDAGLDDVGQRDDAEHPMVLGDRQGRRPAPRHPVHQRLCLVGKGAAFRLHEPADGVGRTLTDAHTTVVVQPRQSRLGGEWHKPSAGLALARPDRGPD